MYICEYTLQREGILCPLNPTTPMLMAQRTCCSNSNQLRAMETTFSPVTHHP